MKTTCLLISALCLFCALAAADDPAANPDSLPSNPVYKKNCAKCHGKTAGGRHFAGSSLRSEKVSAAPVDDLRTIIEKGKGHMPKFAGKLTPADIDKVILQIKAANQK
ncbi:MAG: c-type cytochrome [Terriglobales bacterium]